MSSLKNVCNYETIAVKKKVSPHTTFKMISAQVLNRKMNPVLLKIPTESQNPLSEYIWIELRTLSVIKIENRTEYVRIVLLHVKPNFP